MFLMVMIHLEILYDLFRIYIFNINAVNKVQSTCQCLNSMQNVSVTYVTLVP